jgi:hypothetical protein
MSTWKPYYRRRMPTVTITEADVNAEGKLIDLSPIPTPKYMPADAVGEAVAQRDNRAAAVVAAAVGLGDVDINGKPRLRSHSTIFWKGSGLTEEPLPPMFQSYDLCEFKWYGPYTGRYLLRGKSLAVAAYQDYFPGTTWTTLRPWLSGVVLMAKPGYAGTFGPGVDAATDLGDASEGNYDMNQMMLLPLAYAYYNELTTQAREHLIQQLLAHGRIHRPRRPEIFTSGSLPNDWSRAGFVSPLGKHIDIGETENHILMLLAIRYLTNQLLYQRDHKTSHDNRRNGGDGAPSCFDLVLALLRNIMRGDFSEYNAKPYQEETRHALVNLCSYAYDHEVRLAARMVLDYISAKVAVSQTDLRRMLPFRRRNQDEYSAHFTNRFMGVSLLSTKGSDPMGPYFALQAGNIRCCAVRVEGSVPIGVGPMRASTGEVTVWGIEGSGEDLVAEAVSEYRIPPLIHDLFVGDLHRRYYQRLHRFPKPGEVGGNRNVNLMEIFAGSPSYLITAGSEPATYAIDPRVFGFVIGPSKQRQQLGVAVTTSFIPTTGCGGSRLLMDQATQVIQFGAFSSQTPSPLTLDSAMNYGVAPDFACGHQIRIPGWIGAAAESGFTFFDHHSVDKGASPGFYLAVLKQDGLAAIEALDTWLHPDVTFADFRASVLAKNGGISLSSNVTATWRTWSGTHVDFVIWRARERGNAMWGAQVLSVGYGAGDVQDAFGDAGNVTNRFLNGTVLTYGPEAVIEVHHPFNGTKLRLDLANRYYPRRTDETGHIEWAGGNEEVWADFDWTGPQEGDVCRPWATPSAAQSAVANHGSIRMIPSISPDRGPLGVGKRFRMVAPIGGVRIG